MACHLCCLLIYAIFEANFVFFLPHFVFWAGYGIRLYCFLVILRADRADAFTHYVRFQGHNNMHMSHTGVTNEPRHEKTCLRGLRPGLIQTGLLSYRSKLDSRNLKI